MISRDGIDSGGDRQADADRLDLAGFGAVDGRAVTNAVTRL
jgi:hypothetical protein